MEFRSNRRIYYLKAHIVLSTKYRRDVLKDGLDISLCDYIKSLNCYGYITENVNSDLDHIHILVSYKPQISITSIIKEIKQYSTIYIWKLYYKTLSLYYYKKRVLWSKGYYVSSIGLNNEISLNKYIDNQS